MLHSAWTGHTPSTLSWTCWRRPNATWQRTFVATKPAAAHSSTLQVNTVSDSTLGLAAPLGYSKGTFVTAAYETDKGICLLGRMEARNLSN